MTHDLHIIRDGRPFTPLELVVKLGRPSAAVIIGEQIEALIATLDRLDGDPDLEEDDPSGGDPIDLGEAEAGRLMPIYGVDQASGPRNFRSALDAYLAAEGAQA
jgi:hypothetical protein